MLHLEEEEIKQYTDEKLKEKFVDIKREFDTIECNIDDLVSVRKRNLDEIKNSANSHTKDKEYLYSLRKLIESDMEYRHNSLIDKMNEAPPKTSSSDKIIFYLWIAIAVIFVLQIITFLKM